MPFQFDCSYHCFQSGILTCHMAWEGNIHPLTYECYNICLHKTNKSKNYPPITLGNKTSAHVQEILEHPIRLSPLHYGRHRAGITVPQTSQRKHATACLLPVWILITKQFSFVSLINFCLFYFCSHSDVLSKVSATSPVPPFPFSQLSHEILLCLGVCFLKSLCVFCLKQTLSDHPTYYALPKGHALCRERKALLLWLRNNKLDRHWKQGLSPRVQDYGKMFHSCL